MVPLSHPSVVWRFVLLDGAALSLSFFVLFVPEKWWSSLLLLSGAACPSLSLFVGGAALPSFFGVVLLVPLGFFCLFFHSFCVGLLSPPPPPFRWL